MCLFFLFWTFQFLITALPENDQGKRCKTITQSCINNRISVIIIEVLSKYITCLLLILKGDGTWDGLTID